MKKQIYVPFEPHGTLHTIKIKMKSWITRQVKKYPIPLICILLIAAWIIMGGIIFFGGFE